MATISNLGVGSGLDLNTLYSQLQSAEQGKLATITQQKTNYQSQISAYGRLQNSLQTLASVTATLQKPTTYNGTAVTSSNTAFSATTDNTSSAGNYSVVVSQLASAQSLQSGTFSSNTDQQGTAGVAAGSRVLTIAQAGKDPLKITLTDDQTSLNGISDAINKSGGNVTATVVKAKDGDFRLLLSSKSTGEKSEMTVSVSGDDKLQSAIGYSSSATATENGLTQQTAGQDSKLTVNGIAIQRDSNTVTGAPQGVTLQLKAVSKDSTGEQLTIGQSADATKQAINAWVTAYNSVQTTIASVTKYTAVDKGADQSSGNGVLIGNGTVRSIQTSLASQLSSVQAAGVSSLAQLGITSDPKTGQLNVDDKKLTAAIANNPQAVSAFFVGDGKTTGFATGMVNKLTPMTDTKTGTLQNAMDGANATIKSLQKSYEAMSDRIDTTMANYKQQFTNLDALVSKLNNTASYLTSQFSNSNNK